MSFYLQKPSGAPPWTGWMACSRVVWWWAARWRWSSVFRLAVPLYAFAWTPVPASQPLAVTVVMVFGVPVAPITHELTDRMVSS